MCLRFPTTFRRMNEVLVRPYQLIKRDTMTMADIFISYTWDDRDFVKSLTRALEAKSISVWDADGQVEIGHSLVGKISDAMASIRLAILVISPQFLNKKWPMHELRQLVALALNDPRRRIIPILRGLSGPEFMSAVPIMADIKWLSSERGLEWVVSSLMILLAEPSNRALPRDQTVVEHRGTITRFKTLRQAVDAAEPEFYDHSVPG